MKITALGTNGWFDSETGQTMCTLVQTDDLSILFDAGFGIQKARALLDFKKPAVLFLSHLHYDHTAGLHLLGLFPFAFPLKVILPAGQKNAFFQMGGYPYTADWTKALPNGIEIYDTDELEKAGLPFKLTVLPLQHPVPDMGYRLEWADGKTLAYLTDTGYCENAVTLGMDADLIITECGALPGTVKPGWGHMEPELCAKLGNVTRAKRILLTHFSAGDYPTLGRREEVVSTARPLYPNLITGTDGLELFL